MSSRRAHSGSWSEEGSGDYRVEHSATEISGNGRTERGDVERRKERSGSRTSAKSGEYNNGMPHSDEAVTKSVSRNKQNFTNEPARGHPTST